MPDLRKPRVAGDMIADIMTLFAARGNDHYGEAVTQREHAEQCAFHARADGADEANIAAALLHDIGHLLQKVGEDAAERGIDAQHERIGAGYLARIFGPEVSEPVALHVAAKRYLATVDPTYVGRLSPASALSLRLQGGLMDAEELEAFEAHPYHQPAIRLRYYDELGKVIGADMPDVFSYEPMLLSLARQAG